MSSHQRKVPLNPKCLWKFRGRVHIVEWERTKLPLVGYPHLLFLSINSFNLLSSKAEIKHNNIRMSFVGKIYLDDNVITGTPVPLLVYEIHVLFHLEFFLAPFIFIFFIAHFTSSTLFLKIRVLFFYYLIIFTIYLSIEQERQTSLTIGSKKQLEL